MIASDALTMAGPQILQRYGHYKEKQFLIKHLILFFHIPSLHNITVILSHSGRHKVTVMMLRIQISFYSIVFDFTQYYHYNRHIL